MRAGEQNTCNQSQNNDRKTYHHLKVTINVKLHFIIVSTFLLWLSKSINLRKIMLSSIFRVTFRCVLRPVKTSASKCDWFCDFVYTSDLKAAIFRSASASNRINSTNTYTKEWTNTARIHNNRALSIFHGNRTELGKNIDLLFYPSGISGNLATLLEYTRSDCSSSVLQCESRLPSSLWTKN